MRPLAAALLVALIAAPAVAESPESEFLAKYREALKRHKAANATLRIEAKSSSHILMANAKKEIIPRDSTGQFRYLASGGHALMVSTSESGDRFVERLIVRNSDRRGFVLRRSTRRGILPRIPRRGPGGDRLQRMEAPVS